MATKIGSLRAPLSTDPQEFSTSKSGNLKDQDHQPDQSSLRVDDAIAILERELTTQAALIDQLVDALGPVLCEIEEVKCGSLGGVDPACPCAARLLESWGALQNHNMRLHMLLGRIRL